jgi:itaconate CoA-transferase
VDSPAGKLPALLPPGRNAAFTPRMDPVPGLGQHTGSILGELGFSAEDQARLQAAGVV